MCIAAAIIGVGLVGAAGSVIAGGEAASATTSATNAAINAQQSALGQEEQLTAPYRAAGQTALPQLETLLGLGPQGAGGIQQALTQMPGYKFAQQQGETGIANQASLAGGVSGNTLAALDTFNTGLADQTYQTQVGDLMGLTQLGANAATNTAGNVAGTANNVSNLVTNQGTNNANIAIGEAQGITGAVSGIESGLLTQQALSQQAQLIAALNT